MGGTYRFTGLDSVLWPPIRCRNLTLRTTAHLHLSCWFVILETVTCNTDRSVKEQARKEPGYSPHTRRDRRKGKKKGKKRERRIWRQPCCPRMGIHCTFDVFSFRMFRHPPHQKKAAALFPVPSPCCSNRCLVPECPFFGTPSSRLTTQHSPPR
ncbi:hypothetical protein VTK73DRAFT_4503 [Phialemonium thermophilum]|uniref:Uncharacterized protein n=1 Tax=Phialemonium thermophilum TaxID=223376 RepID=A0ABR3V875_9PEZI